MPMPMPIPVVPPVPRPAALGRQSDPPKPRKHRVFAAAGLEVWICLICSAVDPLSASCAKGKIQAVVLKIIIVIGISVVLSDAE